MADRILLTADIVFQYVFGSEESRPILKEFLNAVQRDSGYPPIREIEIANPFNLRDSPTAKLSIVDVRAVDEQGKHYNIEVQSRTHFGFSERTLYYWAQSYAGQLEEGGEYAVLRPVIGVSVLDFVLFTDVDRAHTCFELRERLRPQLLLSDDCVLHYLELPKAELEIGNELAGWLFFLGHGEEEESEEMKALLKDYEAIRRAQERYKRFTSDEEARLAYQARMKFLRDQASFEAAARREGREEGREEGRKEALRETARRMQSAGVSDDVIAEVTGLSSAELAEL